MQFFLDRTISIRRLRSVGTDREAYSATGTAYESCFQTPRPEAVNLYGGDISNLYQVFVDVDADIVSGDHIVQAGIEYAVRDVKTMDFLHGSTQYKMLIVAKGGQSND